MTLEGILYWHGLDDPKLKEDLEALMNAEFERGLDEGASTQAILEVQGRERFLEWVREQYTEKRPTQ